LTADTFIGVRSVTRNKNPVMKTSRTHQPTKQALRAPQSWCVEGLLCGRYLDRSPISASSTQTLRGTRMFAVNQEAGS